MKKRTKVITMLILVFLLLACLGPLTSLATPEKTFIIKNSNGSGKDHGHLLAAYNGSSVVIDSGEAHTFTYEQGENSVRIDFLADPDYRMEYYVVGNSPEQLSANPSFLNVREYTSGCGGNNTISLNPEWTYIDSYTVSFSEGDHGSTDDAKTFTGLHYGDPFPAAPEITPEAGWAFDGWPALPDTVIGDASYTATYTQNDYTITFDVGENGTTNNTTTFSGLHYGDEFPEAPDVTPDSGWEFEGWTPALLDKVQGDGTYHALYKQLTFTITWRNWDDSVLELDTGIDCGTMPSYDGAEPARPRTEQYDFTFSGWSPAVEAVTKDVTYTAQFTTVLRSYTVTFRDYNGDLLTVETVEYGSGATAPELHNRAGYHFTGWDTDFSFVTGDLIVTAQYVINKYKVKFYEADGKTKIGESQNEKWGSAAKIETAPEIAGKTFKGWDLTGDDPSVATSLKNVRENISATAAYKAVFYVVTFVDYNGTELGFDEVAHGGDATPPADPSREGYKFTGWSAEFDDVTGDITVYALYTINTYTVKFVGYNGMVINMQSVNWDNGATAPEAPARDGYIFTGWDVFFNSITKDTIVRAKYEKAAVIPPTAAPVIAQEPIPQTGGAHEWMWWLLLIPGIIILWLIIAVQMSIVPVAESLADNGNGTYTIQWGYDNRKLKRHKVDEDESVFSVITGRLIRSSANPPAEFERGRVEGVFTTTIDRNTKVQWRINNRKEKVDLRKLD